MFGVQNAIGRSEIRNFAVTTADGASRSLHISDVFSYGFMFDSFLCPGFIQEVNVCQSGRLSSVKGSVLDCSALIHCSALIRILASCSLDQEGFQRAATAALTHQHQWCVSECNGRTFLAIRVFEDDQSRALWAFTCGLKISSRHITETAPFGCEEYHIYP